MISTERKNVILVTCHINADFDALGSMIGANAIFQKMFPEADCLLLWTGTNDSMLSQFISEIFTSQGTSRPINFIYSISEVDISQISCLVLVDTKYPKRLKHIEPILDQIKHSRGKFDLYVYDHHPSSGEELIFQLKATKFVSKKVGSASTVISLEIIQYNELLTESFIELSSKEATVKILFHF